MTIVSINRINSDTVKVTVSVEFKTWHDAAKRDGLGMLYGVDICNAVYRAHGVKAINPTVSDTAKPVNGLKVIDLYFQDTAWVEKPLGELIRVDFVARKRVA